METSHNLSKKEINRYSRQLLLPSIGVSGQSSLLENSVLLVGAGGLGSPAALYLAGAGVGKIGIVDHDVVELSNLHRQIIHKESWEGKSKALSAQDTIQMYNSTIQCISYNVLLTKENALDIVKDYDIVLDCSDNVPTRYLVNDCCILLKKPLISGSAIGMEGQITVYNYKNGPCYRCINPKPPPPDVLGNCSNNGVLGVVPGIIGTMQALECIKLITNCGELLVQKLLVFNALTMDFHTIKLPKKRPSCEICGENPKITQLIDYERFAGCKANDKIVAKLVLENSQTISVQEYKKIKDSKIDHILLDVRKTTQYEICHLPNSINIPLSTLKEDMKTIKSSMFKKENFQLPIYVMCRRGIDSQSAVKILLENNLDATNITGGIQEWANCVDSDFPIY